MKDTKNSVEDDQPLTRTIRTCYHTGYMTGTYDILIRVTGLYFTYRVCKYLLNDLVSFPKRFPDPDDK